MDISKSTSNIKSFEYSDLNFKKVNRKENAGGRNIAWWKSYFFFKGNKKERYFFLNKKDIYLEKKVNIKQENE